MNWIEYSLLLYVIEMIDEENITYGDTIDSLITKRERGLSELFELSKGFI